MAAICKVTWALATVAVLTNGVAQAALHDRGGGLLYDDVLNITWLQDANYAKTSGASVDGRMTWEDGVLWTANLVYHDSGRGVDYDGWRMAKNVPVGGEYTPWDYRLSYDGSTDVAYNITGTHSELAYMYYVNLGLKGYYSPEGIYQPDFGLFGEGINTDQKDVGPVKNLQSYLYWSDEHAIGNTFWRYGIQDIRFAWLFNMEVGGQGITSADDLFNVWVVHDGDVTATAAVPEPETYAMMLAGLGLLGFMARRRKQTAA